MAIVLFDTQFREVKELRGVGHIKKRVRQDVHLKYAIGQGKVTQS